MAHMTQEKKAIIKKNVDPILKEYGLKGSLRIDGRSTIVLTITAGKMDFLGHLAKRYIDRGDIHKAKELRERRFFHVNEFSLDHHFAGRYLDCVFGLLRALRSAGWYDRSDPMTDYYDIAYYIDIYIGKLEKPYEVI